MSAFTRAQAEAGQGLYASKCAACHGSELQGVAGPALSGGPFRQRWFTGQRPLADMFRSVAETMPPDASGSLTEAQALESVAFILQRNGLAAGQSALVRAALAAPLTIPDPPAGTVARG